MPATHDLDLSIMAGVAIGRKILVDTSQRNSRNGITITAARSLFPFPGGRIQPCFLDLVRGEPFRTFPPCFMPDWNARKSVKFVRTIQT